MSEHSNIHDDCEAQDCFLPTSRRRFLRDSFVAVAGALVAVGMPKAAAFALPLEPTEPLRSKANQHTYSIPAADGAVVDKANEVILVRWQDTVFAFALSCPHQNTALKWDDRDHGFQCPKHHSRFEASGRYIEGSGRATRAMDRFAVTRDAMGGVNVDLDKLYQEDSDSAEWTAAVIKLK